MDRLVKMEDQLVSAEHLGAKIESVTLKDERNWHHYVLFTIVSLVLSIVSFYVSGIRGMRTRYPHLFAWYDAMRKEKVQGKGAHDYSLYQVCTAANYTATQNLLDTLLIWPSLHFAAANFLLYTIEFFRQRTGSTKTKGGTSGKSEPFLTSVHWCGSREQTGYSKLTGPDGWASVGCATGTLEQKKETLIGNWNRSASEGNPWYTMLPQPVDADSKRAFLSVPIIAELYTDSSSTGGAASACDPASFAQSKIAQLYDGGLCNVAFVATRANQTSAQLFNEYFSVDDSPQVRPSCSGATAAGATQGAVTGATTGLMLAGLIPGAGAIAAAVKVGATVAVSVAAAAAGGATSAAAAKEKCERDDGAV